MAKPGTYQGRHYTEWVDEVKRLKRENLLGEAPFGGRAMVSQFRRPSHRSCRAR